jgi:endonuclease/exonuclease/phosphatase family metal-dependent hydrolase
MKGSNMSQGPGFHATLQAVHAAPTVSKNIGPRLIEIKCDKGRHGVSDGAVDIVSYNILSSATASAGYYRDKDGNVRVFDEDERRKIIYTRLGDWMARKKIICLQEVTDAFLFHEERPREELKALLDKCPYDLYAHFYTFDFKTKTCSLGLAVLVPVDRFAVTNVDLLHPWKAALRSHERHVELEHIEARKQALLHDMILFRKAQQQDDAMAATKEIDCLKERKRMLGIQSKQEIPRYHDRTALVLRLESGSEALLVGTIHMPCLFKDPRMATTIAFQAKQAVLDWASQYDPAPLVFCGDFNSTPGQEGFNCFTGVCGYEEGFVDFDRIQKDEFGKVVASERWIDALSVFNGCTCYGLTQAVVDTRQDPSSRLMPRPLHLDHFFVRDKLNRLEQIGRVCPTWKEVRDRTGDDPLPNTSIGEPSDHLPIELGLHFKRAALPT